MQANGLTALGAYQMMLIGYALGGIMLLLLFLQFSEEIEAEGTPCSTDLKKDWSHELHGIYPNPLEYPPDPGAHDENPAPCDPGFAAAL